MRVLGLFFFSALVLSACQFALDIPDETKVQAYPAWEPAPSQALPTPETT